MMSSILSIRFKQENIYLQYIYSWWIAMQRISRAWTGVQIRQETMRAIREPNNTFHEKVKYKRINLIVPFNKEKRLKEWSTQFCASFFVIALKPIWHKRLFSREATFFFVGIDSLIWIILDCASYRRHIGTPVSNSYCSCSLVFHVSLIAKRELKIKYQAFVAIVFLSPSS